jgi:hypothetical protein
MFRRRQKLQNVCVKKLKKEFSKVKLKENSVSFYLRLQHIFYPRVRGVGLGGPLRVKVKYCTHLNLFSVIQGSTSDAKKVKNVK